MSRKSKRAVGIKYNEAEPSQAPTIVAKGYDDLYRLVDQVHKARGDRIAHKSGVIGYTGNSCSIVIPVWGCVKFPA